ncbi:hypothetical protein AKJ09_08047 [Labilithrix luteola]|uniref:Cell surface protein n=1 Tax=Labilithrix luteola TaxID=1391654 RepID=A0A0K1Q6P3_9BACT|nr:PQQ-binding-like beta-propeller repeat protein [Labilithrix luteola]AKV01384.1 hypothetical protein AKJ09_08047 [Labilithrix luteola]
MRATASAIASGIVATIGLVALDACVGDDPVASARIDDGGGGNDDANTSDGSNVTTDGGPDGDSGPAQDLCSDASGNFIAERAFPFVGTNHGTAGASNGGYVLVGSFSGTAIYAPDAAVMTGTGTTEDAAVVRLDANGNVVWQQHFGGTGSDVFQSVAVDDQDNVYVTGYFSSNTFSIGSFQFNNANRMNLGIVAKLDAATGNPLWAQSFWPGSYGYGCSAIDFSNGHLVVSCSMGQTQTYTLRDGSTAELSAGQIEASSVYELDVTNGGAVWAHSLSTSAGTSTTALTYVQSIDVTATGTVVAGIFSGGALTEKPANAINVPMVGGQTNGFVTELSAQTGAPLWAKGFGDTSGAGEVQSTSAAGASNTGIVVGGSFTGTVDFGAGPHAAAGGSDAFVILLENKSGPPSWDKYFSGTGSDGIKRVRFDVCGRPTVMLFTTSALSAMDGVSFPAPQAGSGGASIIAKLDPKGKLLWANGVTPGGNVDLNGINQDDFGIDAKNTARIVGNFRGTVDLGNGTPENAKGGSHPYEIVYGP